MKVFCLPDLGEGLAEAEIREWHVAEGDSVKTGEPMVSVETAKAIVDIPAPWDGRVEKLHAAVNAIVPVGSPLLGFVGEGEAEPEAEEKGSRADTGTVVGEMQSGGGVLRDEAESVSSAKGGIKATPAVRALARRLEVELTMVTPTGPDGLITTRDVERVARILEDVGPMELLRGPRRAMARSMSQAHAEVVPVTVTEDADLGEWYPGGDISIRLVRALVAAVQAEPALNAWYDSHAIGRRLLKKIDLGIAVDTPEGLFVPVLRDVAGRDAEDLRRALERIKADVRARKIPPEEMRGYTITLSNYGVFGGRYSDPIVVPPTVAILGAGRLRDQVAAVKGKPAVRPVLPLSLTFDHRAVTGGEATRFLMTVVADLQKEK